MNQILSTTIKSSCRYGYFLPKRHCISVISSASETVSKPDNTSQTFKDAPGLREVGPGASKSSIYKNVEYFCYNNVSYFEAEVEMLKYRLPQPSNKTISPHK
ncbi:conserved hypothetical protein [Pediculus humanus corporis]|uniref:Uncharacterized protein n=1 Tax=Pediculus humanus subsp. corporis TaxID=121224 RepID=E0VVH6_PEDHC|nr:uncharacterized protein Phum_PHUM463390 [Pediculus humanus corporis]EEB17382.1 conserved hypothetical protein [Pediculus humanus corporis]